MTYVTDASGNPINLNTNPFVTTQTPVQTYGYGPVQLYNTGFANYPNPYIMTQQPYAPMQAVYVQPQPALVSNTISEGPLGQFQTVTTHVERTENEYLFTGIDVQFDEISKIMRNNGFITDFYSLVGRVESLNEATEKAVLEQIKTDLYNIRPLILDLQLLQLVDTQINKMFAFETRLLPINDDLEIATALSYLILEPKEINIEEAIACLKQVNNLEIASQLKSKIIAAVCSRAERVINSPNKNDKDIAAAIKEIDLAKALNGSADRLNPLRAKLAENPNSCVVQ